MTHTTKTTYDSLMNKYEFAKESATRFGSWSEMDKFVKEILREISQETESWQPEYQA